MDCRGHASTPGNSPPQPTGIPIAASMAFDTKRNQPVIPPNQQNAITIVQVR